MPKIVRISSKLMPTLHTFDMCIYQSSSFWTIHYIVENDIVSTRVFYAVQILLSAERHWTKVFEHHKDLHPLIVPFIN